nr:MAG TPA_asm: periplasmic serine protease [Caudoviricetes sp.]
MKISLTMKLEKLEEYLKGDVMFFFGSITPVQIQKYRFLLEELQVDKKYDTLYIILNTPGGSVETVERFVNMNRHFYKNVNFIVPDEAMSAGTVFCLSGDKIYMDYSSSLGPIDPQVYSQHRC